MYYEHFGFQLPPFSISPDPQFLYLTQRHRDAMAHLIYGVGENGGFVLLTGQVGTGKTTLIRSLLSQELPDVDIALCLHSGLSVIDFVASILDELHIDYPDNPHSLKPLVDALNAYLLQKHAEARQTVLIIDEGQNLSREVLEQVRLLTNLETDNQKLLRIILVGQEELQDSLNRPDLRQLSQRITGRYHLTALNAGEVSEYITHRIKTAKGNPSIFSSAAIKQVYRHSGGVPRLINVLCDRALLVAFNSDVYRVSAKHVKIAVTETMPQSIDTHRSKVFLRPVFNSFLLLLGVLTLILFAYGAYRLLAYAERSGKPAIERSETAPQPVPQPIKEEEKNNEKTNEKTNEVSRETLNETGSQTTHSPSQITSAPNNHTSDNQDTKDIKNTQPTVTDHMSANPTTKTPADKPLSNEADTVPINNNTSRQTANQAHLDSKKPMLAAVALLQPQPPELIEQGVNQADGVKILLKRWELSVDMPANKTACQYAETQQMQCLMTRGGLPLVHTINRPLLLELKKGEKTSWLPIVGFNSQQQPICIADGVTQMCDTGDIARYWSGNLLVLLRKPTVSIKITPGFEGEQIHWLRQRIAIAENRNLDNINTSLLFDEKLVDKVKNFQQSRFIGVDGIVGNETLLYLHNVVADETTPILSAGEN